MKYGNVTVDKKAVCRLKNSNRRRRGVAFAGKHVLSKCRKENRKWLEGDGEQEQTPAWVKANKYLTIHTIKQFSSSEFCTKPLIHHKIQPWPLQGSTLTMARWLWPQKVTLWPPNIPCRWPPVATKFYPHTVSLHQRNVPTVQSTTPTCVQLLSPQNRLSVSSSSWPAAG